MYHHLDTTKKQFVGKTVQSVTRAGDAAVLVTFADGSGVEITVKGDCCSNSIFYAIDLPDNLPGAVVTDLVEKVYWGDPDPAADSERVALEKVKASGIDFFPEENSVWNVTLKTDRGDIILRHINSSNGYYDGYTGYRVVGA